MGIAAWLWCAAAHAQSVDGGAPPDTAAAVATPAEAPPAPPDDRASGVLVAEPRGAKPLLWVPRVILFLPRWVFELALDPLRLGVWSIDRYQVPQRLHDLFFTEDNRFGAYPLGFFETGFGINVGARIVGDDVFHHHEKMFVEADYGGDVAQRYYFKFRSGELLGSRVQLQFRSNLQIVPKTNFYGIGNGNLVTAPPPMLIDALHDPTAFPTRVGQTNLFDSLTAEIKLLRWLRGDAMLAYVYRSFTDRDLDLGNHEFSVATTVYDPKTIIGYEQGLSALHGELSLIVDTLHATSELTSAAVPIGSKVTAYAGYTGGFGSDPSHYVRYGVDALHNFNLYGGDRILTLRVYAEGVTTDLSQIPFTDLPRLGGPQFLRGYARDRFRDRGLWMGTAEYSYPWSEFLSGFFFVDAGRVERDLADPSFDNVRVGIGGGVELHSLTAFLLRFQLAGSFDEPGLFVRLSVDPLYVHKPRATETLSW